MTHAFDVLGQKVSNPVSHMVSYRGKDGKQSYHQTDELTDAVQFVEHLRNDEAVDHARIYKLEEMSFEFRPYYRVEMATAALLPPPPAVDADAPEWTDATDDAHAAPADEADPLAAAWSATDRGDTADEQESVGAGIGRRGLFGR